MKTAVFNVPNAATDNPMGAAYLQLTDKVMKGLSTARKVLKKHEHFQDITVEATVHFIQDKQHQDPLSRKALEVNSGRSFVTDLPPTGEQDTKCWLSANRTGVFCTYLSAGEYGESDIIEWGRVMVPLLDATELVHIDLPELAKLHGWVSHKDGVKYLASYHYQEPLENGEEPSDPAEIQLVPDEGSEEDSTPDLWPLLEGFKAKRIGMILSLSLNDRSESFTLVPK